MIGGISSGLTSGILNNMGGGAAAGIGSGGGQLPGGGGGLAKGLTADQDFGGGGGSAGGVGGVGGIGGIMPTRAASPTEGATFGDALRSFVVERPSADKNAADSLAARFAAGDKSIDPGQLATATAKAGIEIQMSTRTISQTVQAVRTLFQMQI